MARQEPHWPGPSGVHGPVGQADVKCLSTLRSRSDECCEGDAGGHGSREQGDLHQDGGLWEIMPTAATRRGTCRGSGARPLSPSIHLIPRSPGGAPRVPLLQHTPSPLTSAADRRQNLQAGHGVSPSAPGGGRTGSPGGEGGHCKARHLLRFAPCSGQCHIQELPWPNLRGQSKSTRLGKRRKTNSQHQAVLKITLQNGLKIDPNTQFPWQRPHA